MGQVVAQVVGYDGFSSWCKVENLAGKIKDNREIKKLYVKGPTSSYLYWNLRAVRTRCY